MAKRRQLQFKTDKNNSAPLTSDCFFYPSKIYALVMRGADNLMLEL